MATIFVLKKFSLFFVHSLTSTLIRNLLSPSILSLIHSTTVVRMQLPVSTNNFLNPWNLQTSLRTVSDETRVLQRRLFWWFSVQDQESLYFMVSADCVVHKAKDWHHFPEQVGGLCQVFFCWFVASVSDPQQSSSFSDGCLCDQGKFQWAWQQ